jgi:valyl-tRNA synthetase
LENPDLFAKVFPYDLRPQGQDIIRTWLFSTLLRSELEHGELPWSNAAISGWILDPDRKKMSKSKGNVVVPNDLLEEHGSDAVRYWAASARLGTDAAFDVGQMKIGRRLAIKLLNAARFALSFTSPIENPQVSEEIDKSMLGGLAEVVDQATKAFENYDHTRALEVTEKFFWTFTDDYMELVKERAYGQQGNYTPEQRASAVLALRIALANLVRLFAPFIPYAAEEVWSWWQEGSVHTSTWPKVEDIEPTASSELLDLASEALILIRKSKSDAKLSMKAEIISCELASPKVNLLRTIEEDLKAVGRIQKIEFAESDSVKLTAVELAPAE